jgi:transporter family protein
MRYNRPLLLKGCGMKLWWLYALLGAFFGGLMPVLVKRGLIMEDGRTMDSNHATAIRVVMLIAPVWLLVWMQGTSNQIGNFSKLNWLFLALSAAATGLSWLFMFKALQHADAARVMPIDKFSLVVTVVLGVLFLGESVNWRLVLAVILIVAGTLLAIQRPSSKEPPKDETKGAAQLAPEGARAAGERV